ncbi:MAG: GlsB/YeaQ/YmgE family stress response membrane protein [Tissierellia bacterium]|nr:GlsB/YeaQ/YmgE family stress response membrane protein [Tissierellia bacterium]
MGIIASIIVGALCGWIASKIMNTDAEMGALANIVAGVVGSAIGGTIVQFFGFSKEGGLLWSILVGVLGACILIWIVKKIKH